MAMIDWVTFRIPCQHSISVNGGQVISINPDGEQEWKVEKRLKIAGSYDSSLQVRECGPTMLEVTGNPVKWFQGHNIFGSDDLVALIHDTMQVLVPILHLEPSESDHRAWEKGIYELTRVDVTETFLLKSKSDVLAWLRSAEYSAYLRHRGRGQLHKNSTLYFGKSSRRWSLKCYSKGDEIEASGHRLPQGFSVIHGLMDYAARALRIEVVLRSMELKKQGLNLAMNWIDRDTIELHQSYMAGLQMSENHTIPPAVLDHLPPRLVAVYHLWNEGHDIRAMYPKMTFYRYRKAFLEHGIDIAIKQPGTDRSNVVPLVRYLEAVGPAGIPAWAEGTQYYYLPCQSRTA